MNKKERLGEKEAFLAALTDFVKGLGDYISAEDGQWTVKKFIDIYKNIYTISSDTKIVSKILEIHLFPRILQFAQNNGYSIVLAEHQNWYPDFSFVKQSNRAVKFAVDLKTTYRNPNFPGHVNGFTLGSHGAYFKDRKSTKNIQFPYAEYFGHFCLGIIYSRTNAKDLDETEVIHVKELDSEKSRKPSHRYRVTSVDHLRSIASVVKDFQSLCAKSGDWRATSKVLATRPTLARLLMSKTSLPVMVSSQNLARNGSMNRMNHGVSTMIKKGKATPIRSIEDFLDFKGKGDDKNKIVSMNTKKKTKKVEKECE